MDLTCSRVCEKCDPVLWEAEMGGSVSGEIGENWEKTMLGLPGKPAEKWGICSQKEMGIQAAKVGV